MNRNIATLAALFLGCVIPSAAHADGLVDNVNGISIARDGTVTRFTGLVIDDDGRVQELLRDRDDRPDTPDFRLDGQGRTLMPGFIDAHGHVIGLGFQAMLLDLSDTNSLDEALAKISAYARENPEAPWILGRGWNQERWGLDRFPTAADLDRAVADRPVWLSRVDGHAGWANSRALAIASITPATKSREGGRIEMVGGKPSGVFIDNAQALVEAVVPEPLPRDYDRAFALAQEILLENGITTTADMGTTINEWQAYRRAGDLDTLKVRILSYGGDIENMVAIAGPRPTPWLYDDRLRMVGVKLYLDGALGSRGAWLKAPYADAPGQTGLPLLSYSELRNKMVRASMDGFQLAIHAIGDRANAEVLNAIAEVAPSFSGDRRWRIEHAQIVDPADLAKFARYGTIASMQPTHMASDWQMAMARMGADLSPNGRLGGAYAWNTMIANGVPLAFGSDYPVEHPNPFPGLAVAVSRTDANGQPVGGWIPNQAVAIGQALAGFTSGAAYAGMAEDRLGTLEPGKRADFILLDIDPTRAAPEQLRNARVLETWVNGERLYVNGAGVADPAQPQDVRGEDIGPTEGR